jgi:hypothetical protein
VVVRVTKDSRDCGQETIWMAGGGVALLCVRSDAGTGGCQSAGGRGGTWATVDSAFGLGKQNTTQNSPSPRPLLSFVYWKLSVAKGCVGGRAWWALLLYLIYLQPPAHTPQRHPRPQTALSLMKTNKRFKS